MRGQVVKNKKERKEERKKLVFIIGIVLNRLQKKMLTYR
jgi:hypothetical protein